MTPTTSPEAVTLSPETKKDEAKPQLLNNFKFNFSKTQRMARSYIDPRARLWHDDGKNVRLGVERGSRKDILATGDSFNDVVFQLPEAKAAWQKILAEEATK